MTCEYCELIERKQNILFEDDVAIIVVRDLVVTPGQISIIPKEHTTIFEMVPDDVLKRCVTLANKVSIAVFDGLGSQGTNILINNGLGAGQKVPHFAIEIIPRQETDGVNLQWEPKQLMEDEMEMTFSKLTEEAKNISKEKPAKQESEVVKEEKGKDNYLLKSLKRIP
jgi:diadenosine tetraphosphate (Ap4A) HIT family hydrolase